MVLVCHVCLFLPCRQVDPSPDLVMPNERVFGFLFPHCVSADSTRPLSRFHYYSVFSVEIVLSGILPLDCYYAVPKNINNEPPAGAYIIRAECPHTLIMAAHPLLILLVHLRQFCAGKEFADLAVCVVIPLKPRAK